MNPNSGMSATKNNDGDLYYRLSGAVPPTGAVFSVVLGVAVGWLVAIVYAYCVLYVPIIYVTFLATWGMGLVVGYVTAKCATIFKIRSTTIIWVLTLVVASVSYYLVWGYWMSGVIHRYSKSSEGLPTAIKLMRDPALLWDWIRYINEHGTWSMGRSSKTPVKGWFLTIVWIAEALTIFITAIMTATSIMKGKIFCEQCDSWCPESQPLFQTSPGDAQIVKQDLIGRRYQSLAAMPGVQTNEFWDVRHEFCPVCNQLHALTIKQTKINTDAKGNTSNSTTTLVDRMLMEPTAVATIVAQRQQLQAPPPPALPPELPDDQMPPLPPQA